MNKFPLDPGKLSAIVRKEMGHYFASPVGYVVLFVFFLVGGFFYSQGLIYGRAANMGFLFTFLFILLFVTPFMTMRLWSEEEKAGTAELLKTSPLTLWEIVVGKYLGVCAFFAAMSAPTLFYLAVIMATGNPDLPPVAANYLGYFLAAMAFFAVGLLASTLTENQIVAAVIAFGALLLLWVIGWAGESAEGKVGEALKYLSVLQHAEDFFKGIIDLSHVFYFLSVIFLGLFFSVKVLEGKRS